MLTDVWNEKHRIFSIISCYYDNRMKPHSYGDGSVLSNFEYLQDLKGTSKLVGGAFKKPIIDLDNFPKTYKIKKRRK